MKRVQKPQGWVPKGRMASSEWIVCMQVRKRWLESP